MTVLRHKLTTKAATVEKSLRASVQATRKPSKYLSTKVEVDGRLFHSKKEAARYGELKLLQRAGEISDLQCQPRYALMVNERRICGYIADFSYRDKNGAEVTEDVKSEYTAKLNEFRIKAKLFRALYGRDILIT